MSEALRSPETARRMAGAAAAFLEALDPDRRQKASFAFDDDERLVWHYVPMERRGLPLGEMTDAERAAALALAGSALSESGARTAEAIVAHEEILGALEREQGTSWLRRDPGLYYWSVFGDPPGTAPWGWRAEGHHLSLHVTVAGEAVAATPSFFGANPAEVPSGSSKGLRILAPVEDGGRALFASLDAAQRGRALVDAEAPPDVLTTNEVPARLDDDRGIAGGDLDPAQREMLVALIREYTARFRAPLDGAAFERLQLAGIERVRFAWAGSAVPREPHYYRITGPGFLVEYDNTQNDANHIHAVWRDPDGDFGLDLLRAHRARGHAD